jgi:hypothetical protein
MYKADRMNNNFQTNMNITRSRSIDDSKDSSTVINDRSNQFNRTYSNVVQNDRKFVSNKNATSVTTTSSSNQNNFKENYQDRYKEINQDLIKYVYSSIDISRFRYDLLKYEQQLNKLLFGKYFVSPNFYGKNCFLVFTKLKSKYYSFLIDRRQLSYTLDKVNFEEVYVHHCNVDVDLSIYNGTIFDGVYIKKNMLHSNAKFRPIDSHHEFIVTDVYTFKGADYTGNKLNHKLFELEIYLENINSQIKFIRDRINAKTNLELKVNKLHDISNIRQFINNDLKIYEKNYQVKGVSFYPEMSGTKLIHLFDNDYTNNDDNGTSSGPIGTSSGPVCTSSRRAHPVGINNVDNIINSINHDNLLNRQEEYDSNSSVETTKPRFYKNNSLAFDNTKDNDLVKNVSNNSIPNCQSQTNSPKRMLQPRQMNTQKNNNLVKRVYVAKFNEPIYAVLEMKATKITDNYKLFAVEEVNIDGAIRYKKCQMDIAYIPNMEKSKWCRDVTTNSPKGSVFVKCVWNQEKNKWEPLELKPGIKLPSLMEDIRKDIVELEKSDSDTDDAN